jgi:hypothetical protein
MPANVSICTALAKTLDGKSSPQQLAGPVHLPQLKRVLVNS